MSGIPEITLDIALTLAVTFGSLVLFVWGRLRIEVVGLLVMTAVIVLGLVSPGQGIAGFANEAVVTVALVLGLSAGLLRTGAVDVLARWIEQVAGHSEWRLTAAVLVIVIPVSALINNTATVAILLPMVMGLSRSAGVTPSRLLMPLSFGSQMGGSLTVIGTSTNLLVVGMVLELGMDRIGLFEITLPGLVLAAAGATYLLTVGRWITPHRASAETSVLRHELREYASELSVDPESELVGATVRQSGLEDQYGVQVVALYRDGRPIPDFPAAEIAAGDSVLVSGRSEAIVQMAQADRLSVRTTSPGPEAGDGRPEELRLAEMIVSPRSRTIGQPLREVMTRLPADVTVLALQRHGVEVEEPMSEMELTAGDLLLVRSPVDRLRALHEGGDFGLLGVVDLPPKRTSKIRFAVPILAGVILLAATGITTILVSALVGLVGMVLTGCIRPEEIYQEMDWAVIVLLGSLLALGTALQTTGTAELIAAVVVEVVRPLGTTGILAAFFLLTSVLTSVITNNAAAVVLTPVAVAAARGLDVSPMPFVVAVMFAASNAFATPIGYQTNIFIYGPGGYRFSDFLRVGSPLVLLLAAVASLVLPMFFPF
ncbi:MAG TPA: SLC13 family permease [Chondromyces sp.]|nr:SLC13 family permease [Chondromyces sp.]